MKKVLLVDASPRVNGNSESIVNMLAEDLKDQQVCSMAKLFIERWYPFFKYGAPLMSNTSKPGKKGALVCSFWGSPVDATEKYAEWTVSGFSQMGCDKTRAVLFPQIPEKGDVLKKDEYVKYGRL